MGKVIGFLAVLSCCLAVAGCEDKDEKKALAQAAKAKSELSELNADLVRSRKQLGDLKEDLEIVQSVRDELEASVKQLTVERDNAITAGEQTREMVRQMTAQANDQSQKLVELQKEIKEFEAIVADQQTTIAEQQAVIDELQKMIGKQEASGEEQHEEAQEHSEGNEPPLVEES